MGHLLKLCVRQKRQYYDFSIPTVVWMVLQSHFLIALFDLVLCCIPWNAQQAVIVRIVNLRFVTWILISFPVLIVIFTRIIHLTKIV